MFGGTLLTAGLEAGVASPWDPLPAGTGPLFPALSARDEDEALLQIAAVLGAKRKARSSANAE